MARNNCLNSRIISDLVIAAHNKLFVSVQACFCLDMNHIMASGFAKLIILCRSVVLAESTAWNDRAVNPHRDYILIFSSLSGCRRVDYNYSLNNS